MKTINDMSIAHQITFRALRFYEERGLLSPTRVGTQRFYSSLDETRLRVILKGKRLGLSLSEVEDLMLSHVSETADATQSEFEGALVDALPRAVVESKLAGLENARLEVSAALAVLRARQQEITAGE